MLEKVLQGSAGTDPPLYGTLLFDVQTEAVQLDPACRVAEGLNCL